MLARELLGFLVAGIGVAHYAYAGIARKHAFQAPRCRFGAVGYYDHAGVERITDSDPAAVVE